jgi:UDP-2,3-diacylglucosamine pyrophosphatase LpxH
LTPQSDSKREEIRGDRSIIVVSDLHLALDTPEHTSPTADFSRFLSFIQSLFNGEGNAGNPEVMVDGKPRKLLTPEKIILLGDILDLESPRDDTWASVLMDSFPTICSLFQFLLSRGTEIVYVAGNHDNEIAEFEGVFSVSGSGNLKIIRRHWPDDHDLSEKNEKLYRGIEIGDHSYFFMHGQQFDLLFNAVGVFQNYPGWVSKNYMLFRENPGIKWLFRALFGVSLVYVLAKSLEFITTFLDGVMYFLLGISLVIIMFSIEPSTFRRLWDGISMKQNVKTDSIHTIIDGGFWKVDIGKNILADTVVFGHTHVADDSKKRYVQTHKKRFINSGSWGDADRNNTFVYIDTEGPVLFCWPEKKDLPEQIPATPTGAARAIAIPISSFTLWMRNHFWGRG